MSVGCGKENTKKQEQKAHTHTHTRRLREDGTTDIVSLELL